MTLIFAKNNNSLSCSSIWKLNVGIVLEACHYFPLLFRNRFLHRFVTAFLMNLYPTMAPHPGRYLVSLSLLFGDLFRASIFGCIVVAVWLPFGILSAPFLMILMPFRLQACSRIMFFGHPSPRGICRRSFAPQPHANLRQHRALT